MKNKILIYFILSFLTFGLAYGQPKEKVQETTVNSTVTDQNGKPIAGAKVFGKEGAVISKTDADGKFTIKVPISTNLLIEADGYESAVVNQNQAVAGVKLALSEFMNGEKDDVAIAFGTIKRSKLTGNVSTIKPSTFIEYDNSQNVTDAVLGRVAGLTGTSNLHGLGNAMVVLDGIPRYSSLGAVDINVEEIAQISILKDASAVALYGSQARNGVIIITTKRGKAMKRQINVSASYGIANPKALPEYLGSADYMELYNEALVNDGLPVLYDNGTIENYRSGNKYRYPSIDYYSDDFLKKTKNYYNVITEFSGGNKSTQYYANIGWNGQGSLIDFGKPTTSNRLNVRANVDVKINDFITSKLDIAGIYQFWEGPVGNYWSSASTLRPYLFTPLLPMDLLVKNNASINTLLLARKNDVNGIYLLGGTQQNTTTPFADVYSGGSSGSVQRTMQVTNGIDFDLNRFIKGLTATTNFSFDFYNSYNQGIANTYSIYAPTWSSSGDSIIALTQYGEDTKPGTQNVSGDNFLRRIGIFGQLDYNRSFEGGHNIAATFLGFINTIKQTGNFQPDKNTHLGLRMAYDFRGKYFATFSSAYVNSVKLGPGQKGGFSPTLALAWDMTKESFLDENKSIDYLKLKASAGQILSDMSLGGYYYFDDVYTFSWEGGKYTWDDGGSASGSGGNGNGFYTTFGANPLLSYEKRNEYNLGLEGEFFNHSLKLEANYFNTRMADQYTQRNSIYPSFFTSANTSSIPWENYDIDRYSGIELNLGYEKKIKDFTFGLGATMMYMDSKVILKDELYVNKYQYRQGKPVDAIFALESDGFFQSQSEIDNHAFQTFGEVKPGDIKYIDQNNDGLIDNNDAVQIGRWNAPLNFGLQLKLSYKNLTLFAIGTSGVGADATINGDYYWVDGDNKYSIIVKDRWTENTKNTATYPRLSSRSNPNNFRTSDFWMYNNDYFTLNRVQLTYDMPDFVCKKMAMKKLSLYVNGSGIATLSKHNDVRDLNIGREPQYRYFSIGVRTMF